MLDRLAALVFRHRALVLAAFVVATLALGWAARRTHIDASFTKSLPTGHPYIQTFLQHGTEFGGTNRVVIALVAREGDIFTPEFFDLLRRATDEVFFLPGVDRAQVQSIFTPNIRYIEVVEDGFAGGNVILADFTPTPENFARVRENILKSGRVGQLVSADFTGATIFAPLRETDPRTGERINYAAFAALLEEKIRQPFEGPVATVHLIGFAKVIGDVSAGAREVVLFFGLSFVITALLVWRFSHAWSLTLLPLLCSGTAVGWQMGALNLLGYGIDPMSILVPFLVFAIGVSHAVQMVRAFREEVFAGRSERAAGQAAFRQLLVPGGVALLTDTLGFVTMLVIDIPTIRELAINASLGMAAVILTNLLLLPLLLSYAQLPAGLADRVLRRREQSDRWWLRFSNAIMYPRPSQLVLTAAALIGAGAWWVARDIRIGDQHAGVPELRPDSRYNRDTAVITAKFSIGVDLLSVIVETRPDGSVDHEVVTLMDRFATQLQQVEGVQSVLSLTTVAKVVNSGWNEGSLKWRVLPRNPAALAQAVSPIETATGLLNADASVMPVTLFLTDHKAETIRRVTAAVEAFIAAHPSDRARFRLATGNVGVMAATNEVVAAAQFPMLLWVFGAVTLLCFLTFRSWKAVVCIVAPLVLVSWLAYALMVGLRIGLKTSTLPVVALGVGIGVDYGIYLFAGIIASLRAGEYFEDAMFWAFKQTGSAVLFTGLTLAIGTSTWLFSDLQFQRDMGVLLTFMFLVNMLTAVVLLPAMARWLFRHHTRSGLTAAPFPIRRPRGM